MLPDYKQPLRMNLCLVSFIFQLQSPSTSTTVHTTTNFSGLSIRLPQSFRRGYRTVALLLNRCVIARYDLFLTYRYLIRNTCTNIRWLLVSIYLGKCLASSDVQTNSCTGRRATAFLKTAISLCQGNSNRNCVRSRGVQ